MHCFALQACLACKGAILFTGIGKSGFIAQKVCQTLVSTGTKAVFLNPTDALHGDIGIVTREDLVVLVSKSGATDERTARPANLAQARTGSSTGPQMLGEHLVCTVRTTCRQRPATGWAEKQPGLRPAGACTTAARMAHHTQRPNAQKKQPGNGCQSGPKQSKLVAYVEQAGPPLTGPLCTSNGQRQTPLHTDPLEAILASTSALDIGWLSTYTHCMQGSPWPPRLPLRRGSKTLRRPADTPSVAWLSARSKHPAHLHFLATSWQTTEKTRLGAWPCGGRHHHLLVWSREPEDAPSPWLGARMHDCALHHMRRKSTSPLVMSAR